MVFVNLWANSCNNQREVSQNEMQKTKARLLALLSNRGFRKFGVLITVGQSNDDAPQKIADITEYDHCHGLYGKSARLLHEFAYPFLGANIGRVNGNMGTLTTYVSIVGVCKGRYALMCNHVAYEHESEQFREPLSPYTIRHKKKDDKCDYTCEAGCVGSEIGKEDTSQSATSETYKVYSRSIVFPSDRAFDEVFEEGIDGQMQHHLGIVTFSSGHTCMGGSQMDWALVRKEQISPGQFKEAKNIVRLFRCHIFHITNSLVVSTARLNAS